MLFYFITGPVGRQHMLHWSLNFLFLSFVLCNIKLSNLCNYYFFYLKLKIKSMSMSILIAKLYNVSHSWKKYSTTMWNYFLHAIVVLIYSRITNDLQLWEY